MQVNVIIADVSPLIWECDLIGCVFLDAMSWNAACLQDFLFVILPQTTDTCNQPGLLWTSFPLLFLNPLDKKMTTDTKLLDLWAAVHYLWCVWWKLSGWRHQADTRKLSPWVPLPARAPAVFPCLLGMHGFTGWALLWAEVCRGVCVCVLSLIHIWRCRRWP